MTDATDLPETPETPEGPETPDTFDGPGTAETPEPVPAKIRKPRTFLKSVLSTIIFVIVMLAVYVIHARYFDVNVVLYSALLDGAIALVLVAAVLFLLRFFRGYTRLEVIMLLMIWVLGAYIYAISVPTVLDRSLSFYILEKIDQRGGGVEESALNDIFIHEYIPEYRLMDVRLTEQLNSGTIKIVDGCVKLTPKGRAIASVSSWFRRNLLPKHRELMGKYTNVLTDPLKNSNPNVNYKC